MCCCRIGLHGWALDLERTGTSTACLQGQEDLIASLPLCPTWGDLRCRPTLMACLPHGCSPLLPQWAMVPDLTDTPWVSMHTGMFYLVFFEPFTKTGMIKMWLYFYRSSSSTNEHDATSTSSSRQPATSPFWTSSTMATAGPASTSYQQHGY